MGKHDCQHLGYSSTASILLTTVHRNVYFFLLFSTSVHFVYLFSWRGLVMVGVAMTALGAVPSTKFASHLVFEDHHWKT